LSLFRHQSITQNSTDSKKTKSSIVEPGNKDELSEAILNLCSDVTILNQMGENGRQMMEEKFDKQVQFEEFLQYFKKVTGK